MRQLLILFLLLLTLPATALAQTTTTPPTTPQTTADSTSNVNVTTLLGREVGGTYNAASDIKYSGHTYSTPSVAGPISAAPTRA